MVERLRHVLNADGAVQGDERLLVFELGLRLEGAVVDRAGMADHGVGFSFLGRGRIRPLFSGRWLPAEWGRSMVW